MNSLKNLIQIKGSNKILNGEQLLNRNIFNQIFFSQILYKFGSNFLGFQLTKRQRKTSTVHL